MRSQRAESWVVYRMPVKGTPDGMNAVCEAAEWAALEAARPGYLTLVRQGIVNEGEAERLARGVSGDPKPRGPRPATTTYVGATPSVAPSAVS